MKTARLARKPDHVPAPTTEGLKKRCACGKHTPGGERCEECRRRQGDGPALRRRGLGSGPAVAPPIVGEVLRGGGEALPAGVRSRVEGPFARDLGHVRVHTGPQAADSARAVQARAYTVGDHVVFGAGEYAPHTPDGLWLLSHELAHTAQDGGGVQRVAEDGIPIGPDHDPAEREADAAADAVLADRSVALADLHPDRLLRLRRAPWGPCPSGEEVDARDEAIFGPAEEKMVNYYRGQVSQSNRVFNNFFHPHTLKGFVRSASTDPLADFIAETRDRFYSQERERDVTRQVVAEQTRPGEEPMLGPGIEKGNLRVVERTGATKEPDVLDFGNMLVYDVTTLNQSRRKRDRTIPEYVELLQRAHTAIAQELPGLTIPTNPWAAGTTLNVPPPEVYQFRPRHRPDVIICYGPTDLAANHGVISYVAIKAPPGAEGETPGAKPTEEFSVEFKDKDVATTLTFHVFRDEPETLLDTGDNAAEARKVPGLLFFRFRKGKGKGASVLSAYGFADLDQAKLDKLVAGQSVKDLFQFDYKADKGKPLNQSGMKKARKLKLKFSDADLTPSLTSAGLTASGPVRTTLPLLRNAPLFLTLGPNLARLELRGSPKKISPTIPYFRITEASLGISALPEFEAGGQLGVAFGPGGKTYADGTLKVTADEHGLVATADLVGHIPGVDNARGTVTYQNGQLSGSMEISTSQIKLPGVRSAAVTATFSNARGLDIGGRVEAMLPGNIPASFEVRRNDAGRVVYTGQAAFNVPRLNPVRIAVRYDGEHFTGTADTGITIAGLEGTVHLKYYDGAVTGSGRVDLNTGKAVGSLQVNLSRNGKLSGEGRITYPLTKNLVGTVGVVLAEDGKVRVSGELRAPQPLLLFRPYKGKRVFWPFKQVIPIPGLSIGRIGLRGTLAAEFGAEYEVGPGFLHDVFVGAKFDPLEADPNLEVEGGGKLVIPASAKVYVKADAKIDVGADILIAHASAGGGLHVYGEVKLAGGIRADAGFKYKQHRFDLTATIKLEGGLTIGLKLGVFVEAEAGFWRWTVRTRKDWTLGRYDWGSGAQLSIGFPFHYSTERDHSPPAENQLEDKAPSIDIVDVLKQMVGLSSSTEKEI